MLVFEGQIYKEGGFWLVEVSGLNLMTQGLTKAEAYDMAESIIKDAVGDRKLKFDLIKLPKGQFLIQSDCTELLIPLLLKKQRQKAGLSVLEASKRMGSNSPNAYGVYEQGRAKPTLEKLSQLLNAVNPSHNVMLKCA